ncbi:MAG: elongation factor 4 [Candidatus Sungbacteria bacterium]|nr:elongation factor 4 [Candidatus Sungbacteria bacterium]
MASHIRNFCIIAHIDHGKSTLADRFLELTGTIEKRKMREQFLDQMELEREKGITIKMQPVRMLWRPPSTNYESSTNIRSVNSNIRKFETDSLFDDEYILNLIDTPGHVDFTYEVSRALAAVEGAILLVDGTQGIQAQTVANLALAQREGLVIIPVINKVDLPTCRIEDTREEISALLGCQEEDIFLVSGKTGEGIEELFRAVVQKIPPPGGKSKHFNAQTEKSSSLRALIFDSQFDAYKGVIAHVRIFNGEVRSKEKVRLVQAGAFFETLEVGEFTPALVKTERLESGMIGYIASGVKDVEKIRVGDTITEFRDEDAEPLPGYEEPKPVVFSSVYPEDADDYDHFRDALRKLKLNDSALFFEPESSLILGRGFRMGFLGMLHLEITDERLQREYGLRLIFSTPSVSYKIKAQSDEEEFVYSAAKFPDNRKGGEIQEPWVALNIISSEKYLGPVMSLLREARGRHLGTEYLGHGRVEIKEEAPLKEIIVDFYDRLKGITEGYGSLSYEILGYRAADLVKLDILVAGERRDEFSTIIPKDRAYEEGRRLTVKLKEILPRALFPIALQAAIGGDVIARETVPALKKDVTGYLYGGDRTRKMKLWKKQQRGKKRLKERGAGSIDIPPDVFMKMLKK